MTAIIVTPEIGFDYVNVMFPGRETGINTAYYMLDKSNLLCVAMDRRYLPLAILLAAELGMAILSSVEVAEIIASDSSFSAVKMNSILLPQNGPKGFEYMDDLEKNILPNPTRLKIPLLNSLSDKAKRLYLMRSDIAEAIMSSAGTPTSILEEYHVFIQILFPTTNPSQQVPFMRNFVVTDNDLNIFSQNPQFIKDTIKALNSMYIHWGLSDIGGEIIVSDQNQYRQTIGNIADHNQARLTRVITTLRSLGWNDRLLKFVKTVMVPDNHINATSRRIWATM